MADDDMVTHKEIQDIVRSFRNENGNSGIANKDMLIYLMHKVDNIEKTSKCQLEHCSDNFTTQKETNYLRNLVYWIAGLGGGLLILLASLLFNHLQIL